MDLAKLRVYVGAERTKTDLLPVLVLDDGQERIVLRTDGDPAFLKIAADRLTAGALELMASVEHRRSPELAA